MKLTTIINELISFRGTPIQGYEETQLEEGQG